MGRSHLAVVQVAEHRFGIALERVAMPARAGEAHAEDVAAVDGGEEFRGSLLDAAVGRIERRLMKWQPKAGETEKL